MEFKWPTEVTDSSKFHELNVSYRHSSQLEYLYSISTAVRAAPWRHPMTLNGIFLWQMHFAEFRWLTDWNIYIIYIYSRSRRTVRPSHDTDYIGIYIHDTLNIYVHDYTYTYSHWLYVYIVWLGLHIHWLYIYITVAPSHDTDNIHISEIAVGISFIVVCLRVYRVE